jgi:hypothetical protein
MPIGQYVPLWTKIVNGVSLVSSQASCLVAFLEVIARTLHRTFGTLLEVLLLVADRAWSLTSIQTAPVAPIQSNRRK